MRGCGEEAQHTMGLEESPSPLGGPESTNPAGRYAHLPLDESKLARKPPEAQCEGLHVEAKTRRGPPLSV
eukprot:7645550-Pyramimonas_sp.AAC.1